ncbi:MAG: FHA domain-containing protein [Verrucomicrobia bacterium]|nr:FHA domain-containing protein [Verrucomicrobiota bacterium]
MPKLHILSGVLEGKVYDLVEERVTVGRAMDNMIRLEDGTVSHHHAMLVLDGADYKLRDLNSTNGTRVNGMRIVETRVSHGDQIRLGSVEMRYEGDAKKASQPLPPSQTGVDLGEAGQRPTASPAFSSVSPFGRKKKKGPGLWVWIAIGLAIAAIAAVVFVVHMLTKLQSG